MNLIIIILGLIIVWRVVFTFSKPMWAGIQLAAVIILLSFLL